MATKDTATAESEQAQAIRVYLKLKGKNPNDAVTFGDLCEIEDRYVAGTLGVE